MRDRSSAQIAIVTTSWDDGQMLDVRLAERLAAYNMPGTFYVAPRYRPLSALTREHMRALSEAGMEIGSHTLTHPRLSMLNRQQALGELVESKHVLEDLLAEPVVSLCYPEGKFNRSVCSLAAAAGYTLARTTLAFRTDLHLDPWRMPVSFQFFPHTSAIHFRHALKEGNLSGVANWFRLWGLEKDLVKLAAAMLEYILKHGGILHIWGHSWEIDAHGLWGLLDDVLRHIANQPGALYLTNAQVLGAIDQ